MNWLRGAGHWERRAWVQDTEAMPAEQWGLVETAHTGLLRAAHVQKVDEHTCESVYTGASLTITVRRELGPEGLEESYSFKNTGQVAIELPLGSVSFTAPLFDQYPTASLSLTSRCHVHLWMGGSSAWINALRMGLAAPHLGLVVTEGSLGAYSQRGGNISDRGTFLLHPTVMTIAGGQTRTIAWRLFWHQGWDDFFVQLGAQPGFVRLSAAHLVVTVGEPLEITAVSKGSLASAQLFANGQPVAAQVDGNHLTASLATSQSEEITVELRNDTDRTWLRANVVTAFADLLEARVKFIVRHQQRNAPGDPLDGAYLSYDNDSGQQVYEARPSDHNAGRERLAMGVLAAMYQPECRDAAFKAKLVASLGRHAAFVARELQDDTGTVFGTVGRKDSERLYNFPWMAQFHLAMFQATGERVYLDRLGANLRSYYARGGEKYYAIGLPVTGTLAALAAAGRDAERVELLVRFRAQADVYVKNGTNFPASEVNFEQSSIAPAVQFLLEVHLATKDPAYLAGARTLLPLLAAFAGWQPDHRLNEVSIRHWDDYWFGKAKLYGDTFPHYWSTLHGVTYAYYAKATGERAWFARARAVCDGNLSLFAARLRQSAARRGTPGRSRETAIEVAMPPMRLSDQLIEICRQTPRSAKPF